jgi:hypothetical protein
MNDENPTLKIRVAFTDSAGGMDCRTVARTLLPEGTEILDAKWGREPSEWLDRGGWGRSRLTDTQRGYVAGCAPYAAEGSTARALLDIIDDLVSNYIPEATA